MKTKLKSNSSDNREVAYYLNATNKIFILYNSDEELIAEFEYKTEQVDQVILNMLLRHGFIERLGTI